MTYETITATPSSPHIGAEIGNIDLIKPLTNKQVAELHDAFARFQVIFFRRPEDRLRRPDQARVGPFRSARQPCRQVDDEQDHRQSVRAQVPL